MSNRYAVIDTGFIIKALIICNKSGKSLLELILEIPGYKFFCHEQILDDIFEKRIIDLKNGELRYC